MAYAAPNNTKSNTYRDVRFGQGIRSTNKQVLTKQVLPTTGDQNVSPPSRPLREATYKR